MFAAHCGSTDRLTLLTLTDIEELRHTSEGIEISYRCPCGEPGLLLTGRGSRRTHDREV